MVRQTIFVLAWVALCLATLVGCRPSAPSDCLVRVNGHELTATELKARAKNVELLIAHREGKSDDYKGRTILRSFMRDYAEIWIQDRAIEDYMTQKGMEIPEKTIVAFKNAAFKNFRGRKDRSFADLAKIPEFNPKLWEDQIFAEARRSVLHEIWMAESPTNFTKAYAEERIARMRAWNASVPLTNACIFARATNLWLQARSCADFGKFAAANTELNDEAQDNGEWASLDERYLVGEPPLPGGDAILAHLKKMKPGDITPPISADNGVMILRLDHLDGEDAYAVSRIYLRLAQEVNPASVEEIIASAQKNYRKQLFDEKVKALVAAARVERVQPNVESYMASHEEVNKGGNE